MGTQFRSFIEAPCLKRSFYKVGAQRRGIPCRSIDPTLSSSLPLLVISFEIATRDSSQAITERANLTCLCFAIWRSAWKIARDFYHDVRRGRGRGPISATLQVSRNNTRRFGTPEIAFCNFKFATRSCQVLIRRVVAMYTRKKYS